MLPWRMISVPADGLCALHATAVACGFRDKPPHDVAHLIRDRVVAHYAGTDAENLIVQLFETRNWNDTSRLEHIANPLEFRDFIVATSSWATSALVIEGWNLRLDEKLSCPHDEVILQLKRRGGALLPRQIDEAQNRSLVIFLHSDNHWSVVLPLEHAIL